MNMMTTNLAEQKTQHCDSPESELTAWFNELQLGYKKEPLPSLAVRKQRLKALKKQLSRYQDVLADAMSEDFGGRSHTESIMADVLAPILDLSLIPI